LKPITRYYILVFLFAILYSINQAKAQKIDEIQISETLQHQPIKEFLDLLHDKYGVKVFYRDLWVVPYEITTTFENTPLLQALNQIFSGHQLAFRQFQDDGILVYRREQGFAGDLQNELQIMVIGDMINVGRYKTARLKGKVIDGKTGETLAGAVVFEPKLKLGASSKSNGEFELEMPTGDHDLQLTFMGFEKAFYKIKLIEDGNAEFQVFEESHSIAEVTVLGLQNDLPRAQMSMIQMSGADIKRLPALMGETDVIKSITMLAGVQTVSELSPGFNVRGGNTDQNLILVNGSPVFNASHLFGFLSLINPDMVEDVRLFKGGTPIKYGERVSSVMEVVFKEGNPEVVRVSGGIGLINSRLSLEGPLTKNHKLTFVAGGRSSYTNWILKKIPDPNISNSVATFYDLSGKATWKFNNHNKLSLMGYFSSDEYSTSIQSVNKYGSALGNLTLNSRFSESLFGELDLAYSKYKYQLTDYANQTPIQSYTLKNSLEYSSAGYNFKWHITPRHNADFGFKAVFNRVSPGEINPIQDPSLIQYQNLSEEKLFEWAVFAGDEFEILPNLSMMAGLRYVWAGNIGKPVVYLYDPEKPADPGNVIDSLTYGTNEVTASYAGFEPRFLLNFDVDDKTSLKLNYQRVRQHIFQLSNSAIVTPAETWKTIDYYMKPLISEQFAVVVENRSLLKNVGLTAELYYKNLKNLIEYKNGAQLIMNENIETALIPTKGYSYGVEVSAEKSSGRLTGYASYVYSVTRQKNTSRFEDENFWNGDYYRSIYDRPHDFTLTTTYNISRRWRFSGNFVFMSGRPVTLPEIRYLYAGEQLIYYSERNKYRMPAYHRADVSITFDENLRKKRMWKGSWTFSVYNLYGRKNPYSVYYKKSIPNESNDYRAYSLYKQSIIGIPVPSLTYNFKF